MARPFRPRRPGSIPDCSDPRAHGPACDCAWAGLQLARITDLNTRQRVKDRYNSIENRSEKNTYLREFVEQLEAGRENEDKVRNKERRIPICHDPDEHGLDCKCAYFEHFMQRRVPTAFHKLVENRYNSIEKRSDKNTYLRELIEESPAAKFKIPDFVWKWEEEEIDDDGVIKKKIKRQNVDLSLYFRDVDLFLYFRDLRKDDDEICALANLAGKDDDEICALAACRT